MKTPFTPANGGCQGLWVGQIGLDRLIGGAFQTPQITVFAQQRLDFVPAPDEFMDQVCADKPRSACNETSHTGQTSPVKKGRRGKETKMEPSRWNFFGLGRHSGT